MTTKSEKDKAKQIQDKCQTVLNALLRDEDNKYCVDCDSKGPRWASWNLGVFLCIRCAGIHRNLGVHISKVKSVNLDSWTPEQVVSLQQMGNSRARAVYEANLPDNFRRPQSDSSLESFIRAKYEQKKYIAREWVPPTLPKVNWEKEIDEELERQKRKKKSNMEQKKPLTISDVPQIPKPRNSASPKPNRIVQTEIKSAPTAATDLLGLQNGEDNFTSFLSAPKKDDVSQKKSETESIKSEEESFFNQPAPSEKEKAKLTKDSILALYGNTPQILPQNNFSIANPNYQTQFQQQNFTNFPQNFAVQHNGAQPHFQPQPSMQQQFQSQMNQFATQQQQQPPLQGGGMPFQAIFPPPPSAAMAQQQFQPTSQYQMAPNSQFASVPPSAGAPTNQFQAMAQFQQSAFGQTAQLNSASGALFGGQQAGTVNPFFGTAPIGNMQQQFNNMTVGSPMAVAKQPQPGAAVASSNVWQ